MKKRRVVGFFLILIIVSLFLMGCERIRRQRVRPEDVEEDVHRGTRGLLMRFARNLPPNKIFDIDALDIFLELENKGASDLRGSRCFLFLSGFDQSIFPQLPKFYQECGDLEGRSIYNPDGGYDTKQFTSPPYSIYLPEAIDSFPQTFVVHACYEYRTKARPIVCINPRLYDITSPVEACVVQDVPMGGGQGGPVAVERVEVDMMKDKVMFKIHVANVGGGTVIKHGTSLRGDTVGSCPNQLEYTNIDIVDIERLDMSGGSMIKCVPEDGFVRLIDNRGKIVCTFLVIERNTAFTTPLIIDLKYSYLDSISKKVEIIKTPS
ncbi:hypothetical protein KY342_00450 [Candidatus Woesearchaeota archaeon]|nr:hypothetical protein [Candidatus Woesearchaeota archaeon]